MFIPQLFSRRSVVITNEPLGKTNFSLDTSGMASFFGGDVAVAAFTSLHLDSHRRWLGWYNSPGTYDVAKRYGRIARSRFLEGLFPDVPTDLVSLLGLADLKGAKYIGAHDGTVLEETCPFSALLMQYCRKEPEQVIKGRETQRMAITIAELSHAPGDAQVVLKQPSIYPPIVAAIPILVSVGTAVICAVFKDWFCFCMIVLGILVNGVSSLVIGSGKFVFQHLVPYVQASEDGILVSENEIVVLKGTANAVNAVIRGVFSLRFKSEPDCRDIGWCSILLVLQLIVQMFLIPQASLFGQIMFITSLGVSWAYNLWLSSVNRDKIQREIFVRGVLQEPKLTRFTLGTRTSAVVFLLLVLRSKESAKIMDMLLPNDTLGWKKFKVDVLERIQNNQELRFDPSFWQDFAVIEERAVLEILYRDAQSSYEGYLQYHSTFSSSHTTTERA